MAKVPREMWSDVLPKNWRELPFMDGVKFAAKFAAIASMDERSEQETSTSGLARFAIAMSELAKELDQ